MPLDACTRHPGAVIAATFRFYAQLNDFLPVAWRQREVRRRFYQRPAVKDPIEALGVPHPEIGRVMINGRAVALEHRIVDGDRVAVYPEFMTLEADAEGCLRPPPPAAFVLDVHLGALARRLRLLGIDATYSNDLDDPDLVALAASGSRVVLTRDRKLLCHSRVVHGAWLRATDPDQQVAEVLARYAVRLRPFSRCLVCNGLLEQVVADCVAGRLPVDVRATQRTVTACTGCGRLYWPGSHHARLQERVARYLEVARG